MLGLKYVWAVRALRWVTPLLCEPSISVLFTCCSFRFRRRTYLFKNEAKETVNNRKSTVKITKLRINCKLNKRSQCVEWRNISTHNKVINWQKLLQSTLWFKLRLTNRVTCIKMSDFFIYIHYTQCGRFVKRQCTKLIPCLLAFSPLQQLQLACWQVMN